MLVTVRVTTFSVGLCFLAASMTAFFIANRRKCVMRLADRPMMGTLLAAFIAGAAAVGVVSIFAGLARL